MPACVHTMYRICMHCRGMCAQFLALPVYMVCPADDTTTGAVRPQLYTYVLGSGVCHGALTCYGATWLVHVPRWDRGRMYVSRPFLASDTGPTMLRALSWLQQQALHFAMSQEYPALHTVFLVAYGWCQRE